MHDYYMKNFTSIAPIQGRIQFWGAEILPFTNLAHHQLASPPSQLPSAHEGGGVPEALNPVPPSDLPI